MAGSGRPLATEGRADTGRAGGPAGSRAGADRALGDGWARAELREPAIGGRGLRLLAQGRDRRARGDSRARCRAGDEPAAGAAAARAGAPRQAWQQRVSKRPALDPYALFEALDRQRVSYVVVGGFTRVVHGSAETTRGLDIVPSLREENLRRLARALDELEARGPDRRPSTPRAWPPQKRSRRVRAPASSGSCRRRGGPAATTTCASEPSARTSAVASALPRLRRRLRPHARS